MIDQVHAQAIHSIEKYLKASSPEKILLEDDLDFGCLAAMELRALSDSNSYLVKSIIFLLLESFSEHAHKEIYKLIRPHGPPIPEKWAFSFIRKVLNEEAIWDVDSQSYTENFSNHLEPVWNNLAHGDWACLAVDLERLDLTQTFLAVAEYFSQIKANLVRRGFNVWKHYFKWIGKGVCTAPVGTSQLYPIHCAALQ